jgi:oligopeptide/dipeptide ABC transporter ATP-binding protein
MPLLEVSQLRVEFPLRGGLLGGRTGVVRAVDQVSLTLDAGETLGLVGESGCGKTTLGRTILRLVAPAAGSIRFQDVDLLALRGKALREMRRHVQMIFQDPFSSLDPRFTVEDTLGEALDIHGLTPDRHRRRERIASLLRDVGLDAGSAARYPHEFSGGQRQRIGIARALAVDPKLIVCDEPVSALDVSVQAQVVNLLRDLQRDRGLAYLFISHDLAVVEHLAHRIAVMYLGRIVETGPARELCSRPRHPYTRALLSAVPTLDPASRRQRLILGGDLPSPLRPPSGCPLHPRCPVAESRCRTDVPPLVDVGPGHSASCFRTAE